MLRIRLIELVRKALDPRDKRFRNHLYIFLICCVISLFIWFLIKMSDEYVAEVSMPVKYDNIPSQKLLVRADNQINIKIRAKGGDIFSVKFLSGSKNLTLNIGQAEIKRSRYFDRYYLLTSNLYNLISGKFDFGHSLVSVSPDTLFLDFEEVMSKKLPVKLDLTYTCKPQYQVYDSIRVIPDSINISGPSSMLDSIQSISSVATVLKDLDRNIESAVALKLPLKDERISYSANQVNVIIPVEKYTESTIEIPIAGLTTEAESTIRTFPEMVQITYQVAIKDFNLVRNDMFLATAAFDPVRDKGKNFIKVSIDRSPEFVRIVRVQPDKVEFLLQK